MLIVQK